MDEEGRAREVSGRNEEHAIAHWRKGAACYNVMKNSAELCPRSTVLWKVELENYKIGYLVEKISKQRLKEWLISS